MLAAARPVQLCAAPERPRCPVEGLPNPATLLMMPVTSHNLSQSQVASQRSGAAVVISQLALSADGADLLAQQPDLFVRPSPPRRSRACYCRVVSPVIMTSFHVSCRSHNWWISSGSGTKRRTGMRWPQSRRAWYAPLSLPLSLQRPLTVLSPFFFWIAACFA